MINIPYASEIRTGNEHKETIDKCVEIVLNDIKRRSSEGLSYTVFAIDYRYADEVKRLFLQKGYTFRPTGYSGGVMQKTEDICW